MAPAGTELPLEMAREFVCATNSRPRRKACIPKGVAAIMIVVVACLVGLAMYLWHDKGHREPSQLRKFLKIRVFWVRHGLSCTNVLDKCSRGQTDAKQLLPAVEKALQKIDIYKHAILNKTFGLEAATVAEGDCTVEVEAPNLLPDQRAENGALVSVHMLYKDPALSDCARMQSAVGGRSFLKWLQKKGIRIDLVGSSFLLRAVETAHGMFHVPCRGGDVLNCTGVFASTDNLVTPLPYIVERARRGRTSIQQDNTPHDVIDQYQMMHDIYGRLIRMDPTYTHSWPRNAQQYEKFKAVLAMVIAPSISKNLVFEAPPVDVFRAAVEMTLPERMGSEDHGKPVSIKWKGGSYATGIEFDKNEYIDLAAPEVNIAIVGHGGMISEYCSAPDDQNNNNAVFEKLFILEVPREGDNRTVLRELRGKCQQVMDAPSKSSSLHELARADVVTCKDSFVVADFLDLVDVPILRDTVCVKNAPESAFSILPPFQ